MFPLKVPNCCPLNCAQVLNSLQSNIQDIAKKEAKARKLPFVITYLGPGWASNFESPFAHDIFNSGGPWLCHQLKTRIQYLSVIFWGYMFLTPIYIHISISYLKNKKGLIPRIQIYGHWFQSITVIFGFVTCIYIYITYFIYDIFQSLGHLQKPKDTA